LVITINRKAITMSHYDEAEKILNGVDSDSRYGPYETHIPALLVALTHAILAVVETPLTIMR
jgi:hypothetical protein